MKIVPLDQIRIGMRLGQNIYRHDGLLAIPKGSVILRKELDTLSYFLLDFVLVSERTELVVAKDDINFTLNILESAYMQSNLWDKEFGKELFAHISKRIIKNRKLRKYLNDLRELDSYSYAQSINISMITATLLSPDKKVDEELANIVLLSLVHDVGRNQMDDIFNKEGKLTEEEFKQLTTHPMVSLKMLKKAGFSEYELKFVTETHEKWDGSGYPQKMKGSEISDLAQLIFISDVYNALSSYRPYRGIYSPYSVIQIIENEKNKMFGEKYIDIFLERFTPYPIGTMVELNNGETAIVSRIRSKRKLLPIVEVIDDLTGERSALIDLAVDNSLRIKKIIQSY